MIKIRLKYWRQRRVMTIAELAAKARVSTQTIVEIEHDKKREVRPATVRKLATALNINPEELVIDDAPAKVA